ncbi:hypothetical protein, partial [Klebsiella pneumoniae]|uniref:hypothetical protein n=1 Tax=Klebsiella pneumoniae TaxID=573 RepID=UPI0039C1BD43
DKLRHHMAVYFFMGALLLRPVYRLFFYCGLGYYFPVFVFRILAGIEKITFFSSHVVSGC